MVGVADNAPWCLTWANTRTPNVVHRVEHRLWVCLDRRLNRQPRCVGEHGVNAR